MAPRRVDGQGGSSRTFSRQMRSGLIVVANAKGAMVVSAGRIGRLRTGSEFQGGDVASVDSVRSGPIVGREPRVIRLRERCDLVHLVARCERLRPGFGRVGWSRRLKR